MRIFYKRLYFILAFSLIFTLLVGFATVSHLGMAGERVGCVASAQAGTQETTISGGQSILMVSFREFCKMPVVVATGNEQVDRVKIGVITPSSVTLIVTGPDVPVRIYWHALPPTK